MHIRDADDVHILHLLHEHMLPRSLKHQILHHHGPCKVGLLLRKVLPQIRQTAATATATAAALAAAAAIAAAVAAAVAVRDPVEWPTSSNLAPFARAPRSSEANV